MRYQASRKYKGTAKSKKTCFGNKWRESAKGESFMWRQWDEEWKERTYFYSRCRRAETNYLQKFEITLNIKITETDSVVKLWMTTQEALLLLLYTYGWLAKLEVLLTFLSAAEKHTVICFNMDNWLSCYHVTSHKHNDITVKPSSQFLEFSCVDRVDEVSLLVWVT